MCASTHPLQTHHISMIYCTKIHEIFKRCTGFIGVFLYGYRFCDFPIVVKCQHKQLRQKCQQVATKLVAMEISLD